MSDRGNGARIPLRLQLVNWRSPASTYIPGYVESAPSHVRQHTGLACRQIVELIKSVPRTAVQVHIFPHANTDGHVFPCHVVIAERYHANR